MELQQHIKNQMCHCFKVYFAGLGEATHIYAARTYFLQLIKNLYFLVPTKKPKPGIIGLIVGIIVGVTVFVILVIVVIYFLKKKKRKLFQLNDA